MIQNFAEKKLTEQTKVNSTGMPTPSFRRHAKVCAHLQAPLIETLAGHPTNLNGKTAQKNG